MKLSLACLKRVDLETVHGEMEDQANVFQRDV